MQTSSIGLPLTDTNRYGTAYPMGPTDEPSGRGHILREMGHIKQETGGRREQMFRAAQMKILRVFPKKESE